MQYLVTTALFAFANQDFPPLTNLEEIKQVDIGKALKPR